jgi:hypothetical protein
MSSLGHARHVTPGGRSATFDDGFTSPSSGRWFADNSFQVLLTHQLEETRSVAVLWLVKIKNTCLSGVLFPASRTLSRVWGWRAGERYT